MSSTEIEKQRLATRKTIISRYLKEYRKISHDVIVDVIKTVRQLDKLPSDDDNYAQEFTGLTESQVTKEVVQENRDELSADFERRTRQFMERILGEDGKVRGTRSRKIKFELFDSGGNVDAQIDNAGMFTWIDESEELLQCPLVLLKTSLRCLKGYLEDLFLPTLL